MAHGLPSATHHDTRYLRPAVKLEGKLVLVTGASSGIGAEMCRALAEQGTRLVLVARGREKLEAVAAEVRERGGEAIVRPADLASLHDVESLAADVLEGRGAPDVLINNAGAGRWRAIDENEPGEAVDQMSLPYLAAFELTRELVPRMIARRSGQIVNVTSAAAFFHFPGANGYANARWAMRAFTENLREDLRGTGVGVTLICPAEVDSPYFDHNPGSRERIPRIGRVVGAMTPEQVARGTVRAIERERRVVYMPWRLTPFIWYARHFPRSTRWMVARTGWKRPEGH
jgi:short-subunit dehydrogenase